MLPIVQQRITRDDIFVRFSNGNSFSVTRDKLREVFKNASGNLTAKRRAVRGYIIDGYKTALGEDIPEGLFQLNVGDGGIVGSVGVGCGDN